jgi:hypothetical protein
MNGFYYKRNRRENNKLKIKTLIEMRFFMKIKKVLITILKVPFSFLNKKIFPFLYKKKNFKEMECVTLI